MRLTRRPKLPAEARAALPLVPGEHVLAFARCADGTWAVATDRSLLVAGDRVDWAVTAHAEWDHESSVLTVEDLRTAGGRPAVRRLRLEEPGFLPETVRERVTSSIVMSRHVPMRGRAGVRVVARRDPSAGEDLRWQVVVDAALDPRDPEVAAFARSALADLRRDLGV